MEMDEKLIFISYTKADQDRVVEISDQLVSHSINVWMDFRRLKPGQHWDFEIRKALDRAAIIVIFISKNSVTKNGYVQREIRLALEKLEEKIIEDIYLIPVLLDDDVNLPTQLKKLQFIRSSEDQFIEKLSDAISHQMQQIGVEIQQTQDTSEISWTGYRISERRDGIPGYEADIRLLRFSSEAFPAVSQIGDYLKAKMLEELFVVRKEIVELDQPYNYGQDRFARTHTIDISSSAPSIKGRVISIMFTCHSYYAMAMHPNMHFRSFSFFIDPLFVISSLEELFEDKEAALATIQVEARRQLLEVRLGEAEDIELDQEWVERGTESWSDFSVFTFGEESIDFAFSPYTVAPYAAGPQFVEIKYQLIKENLKTVFKTALELGI